MSKTVRRLTAGIAAAVMCVGMVFSLTAAAQTSEGYTPDNEYVVSETRGGLIPWYDVLGISVEQLREEMSQNPEDDNSESAMPTGSGESIDLSSLAPEERGEYLLSLPPEELSSLISHSIGDITLSPEEEAELKAECPQKHTPKESKEIHKRLMEVKHPDDLICSDHGEIYLDTRWRGKSVPSSTDCGGEEPE